MNALADRIQSARPRTWSVADPGASLTAVEVDQRVGDTLRQLREASGRQRPTVVVSLPLGVEAMVHLLACVAGDLTACFLDPGATEAHRAAVVSAVQPHVVVEGDGMRPGPGGADADSDGGYVAMSSGSTGSGPKGVLSAWDSVASFVESGAEALRLDASSVWAETGHPSYDLAMTNLLVALSAGSDLRLSASLGDRLRPLRFLDRTGATHQRSAPRFIDLAAAEGRPAPAGLRAWGCGGDRLLVSQVEQLLGFGVPEVVNTYGTSETIGFASAAHLSRQAPVPEYLGTATIGGGRVGPWSVELQPAEDSQVMAIRSEHLPSGYLFGASLDAYPQWGDGEVVTGDRGHRVGEDVFCLGRAGRRVKRRGLFVDLDDVDVRVREVAGTPAFTVALRSGEVVSVVEGSHSAADLRRQLASSLAADRVPDRVVVVRTLPRLGNGKVDQAAVTSVADGA